jgi:hypothetical protein
VPGSLVVNREVIDLLLTLRLAPADGQEAPVAAGGALSQLVGVWGLEVEMLDADFLVIGHAAKGSRRLAPPMA